MSDDPVKRAVGVLVSKLLDPIAPLLLRAGFGVGECEKLVQRAYVEAVLKSAAPAERSAPTIVEIAMRTGLTRRAVTKLIRPAADTAEDDSDIGRQRADRVITGWRHDPDFRDNRSGDPALLPLRGKKRSFTALVQRHSGDARVRLIRKELERVKAIRRRPDGRFELLRETYATSDFNADGVMALAEQVHEHLQTLVHNYGRPPLPLYVRRVTNARFDAEDAGKLLRDMALQGDAVMESVDLALNDPLATVTATDAHRKSTRLGAVFYVFQQPEDPSEKEKPAPSAGHSRARAPGRGRNKRRR